MAELKTTAVVPLFQALPAVIAPAQAVPPDIRVCKDGKSLVIVVGLAIVADATEVAGALHEGACALETLSASLRAFATTAAL